jgi:hypothetical protein
MLFYVTSNVYILVIIVILLSVIAIYWWQGTDRMKKSLPSFDQGPDDGGSLMGKEFAYSTIIDVLNDIDNQMKDLEGLLINREFVLTPQEANGIVERFFYSCQVAEERMKSKDSRKHLSEEQLGKLNSQLEASVERMITLSRKSDTLMQAVQAHYHAEAGT